MGVERTRIDHQVEGLGVLGTRIDQDVLGLEVSDDDWGAGGVEEAQRPAHLRREAHVLRGERT